MKQAFRFATLLKWRERERDEAGVAVGQANEAIRRIDDQREQIAVQQQQIKSASSATKIGSLAVDRLIADGRYVMQLEIELRSLAETRMKLVEALQQRQQRLILAEAEVKRFERLREIDRAAEQKVFQRREQMILDEAMTNRCLMNRRAARSK